MTFNKLAKGLSLNVILALALTLLVVLPDEIYKMVNSNYQAELSSKVTIIIFASYFLAFSSKGGRAPIVLTFFLAGISTNQLLHFEYFGSHVSPNEIPLFFDEIDEITVSLFTLWKESLGAFVVWGLMVFVSFKMVTVSRESRLSLPLASLVLLAVYTLGLPRKAYNDPSVQNYYPNPKAISIANGVRSLSWVLANDLYRAAFGEKRGNKSYVKREPLVVEKLIDKIEPLNIVIVMGESLNPRHMSAYGHERKTTPLLDKRINKGEIKKKIVYSGGVSTKVSIPTFFNLKKYPEDTSALTSGSTNLLALAEEQGMTAWWLSTQSANLSVYSARVDRERFYTKEDVLRGYETKYDLALLDLLKKVDLAKPNFIVLHERGSHSPYEKYHPSDFVKYPETGVTTDELRVNSYHNSLLFSDYVHEEIISYLDENSSLPTIVIFTGDHGELLGEGGYWSHSKLIAGVAEVPFIIWHNKKAKEYADNLYKLKFPTHFEVGKNIATLLGYKVSDPQEQDGVYFVNGKNLAGDASFAKMQLGQGGKILSWEILR